MSKSSFQSVEATLKKLKVQFHQFLGDSKKNSDLKYNREIERKYKRRSSNCMPTTS